MKEEANIAGDGVVLRGCDPGWRQLRVAFGSATVNSRVVGQVLTVWLSVESDSAVVVTGTSIGTHARQPTAAIWLST